MNNFTQLAVRCDDTAISVLEQKGFMNTQNLSAENYSFPVIIVDLKNKKFFGTNITCMAALKPKICNITEIVNII